MTQSQPSSTSAVAVRRISVALEHNPYDVVINCGGVDHLGAELLRIGIRPNTKILVVNPASCSAPVGLVSIERRDV